MTIVAVIFLVSSCFNAREVDPGSLVIDNFNDDAFPVDSMFLPWQCYLFGPVTNRNYSCVFDIDTPDGSTGSLRLDFEVTDPPNGMPDHPGASLITRAARGSYQDFTAFATLAFDAAVRSGVPPLPSDANFYAELGCSTVHLIDGSEPGDVEVLQRALYDRDWKTNTLSLANFSPFDTRPIEGGVAGCLKRVDHIEFVIEAALPDGQSGAGTLKIDNVSLQ